MKIEIERNMSTSGELKLKWVVSTKETGRFASFHKRGWPMADYPNERPAAAIYCEDDYSFAIAKTGNHKPLMLRLADWSQKPWKWVTAKKRYATLAEAKAAAITVLKANPHLIHPDYKPE